MEAGAQGWKRHPLDPLGPRDVRAGEPSNQPYRVSTFFDAECELEGRLVLDGSIRIEGGFVGTIVSSQTVTVGEKASVQADIRARKVVILGTVMGNVAADQEVFLGSSGRLQGALETPCLSIEPGAEIEGATRILRGLPHRELHHTDTKDADQALSQLAPE